MRRLRCYLAGPISKGDLYLNISQANYAFHALAQAGFAPLNPMLSAFSGKITRVRTGIDDFEEVIAVATTGGCGLTHEEWLEVDLAWVRQADAILRLPGESVGADKEVDEANARGIPVFHSIADLIAWRDKLPKDHPDQTIVTTPRRLRSTATVLESRINEHIENGSPVRPLNETFKGVTIAYAADPNYIKIPEGAP
jgi:hypothetical protein